MKAVANFLTPIKVGLFLTLLVICLFLVMAVNWRCELLPTNVLECRTNWAWFLDSKPNEIGDTLAGFAGALAFIWIVSTVWLQSNELSEQREVLQEQKEEFKLMVAAQNAQVKALEAQAEIFRDEKLGRDELKAENYLSELLEAVVVGMREAEKVQIWDSRQTMGSQLVFLDYNVFAVVRTSSTLATIERGIEQLEEFLDQYEKGHLGISKSVSRDSIKHVDTLSDALSDILQLEPKLSDAQRQRMRNLGIRKFDQHLTNYLSYSYIALRKENGWEYPVDSWEYPVDSNPTSDDQKGRTA